MKKTSYACSQPSLYQICLLIALNCKSKIADFVLFSSQYSLTMVEAVIAAIAQAEELPGEEARALEHERLRQELIPINKQSLKLWQYLKRYISKLYPDNPEMQRAAWNAAGWNHYDNNNAWVETKALMNMGSQYILTHKTELLANNNMPATFEALFNEQALLFTTTYTAFGLAEEAAVVGTDAKIDANNGIYNQVITICLDGQAIFEGNDTLKGQFSFEKVSQLVSPQGASAVKFHVANSENGLPMTGVEIQLAGSDKKVTTNESGDAEMTQLAAGTPEFILKADGFSEKRVSMVLTGTTKREDVSMEPLFTGEMNVGSDAASPQQAVGSLQPAVGSAQ
ncbi:MAG: carboxypeptidase-like regulatory domain-containing protein [Bacteroidia bacterium]